VGGREREEKAPVLHKEILIFCTGRREEKRKGGKFQPGRRKERDERGGSVAAGGERSLLSPLSYVEKKGDGLK